MTVSPRPTAPEWRDCHPAPSRISLRSTRADPPPQGAGKKGSIRRQRDLVVDQRIERRLHIDLGVDDAGLLQREACGQDGFALRGADAAVGQFGALLELLVDDRFRLTRGVWSSLKNWGSSTRRER